MVAERLGLPRARLAQAVLLQVVVVEEEIPTHLQPLFLLAALSVVLLVWPLFSLLLSSFCVGTDVGAFPCSASLLVPRLKVLLCHAADPVWLNVQVFCPWPVSSSPDTPMNAFQPVNQASNASVVENYQVNSQQA